MHTGKATCALVHALAASRAASPKPPMMRTFGFVAMAGLVGFVQSSIVGLNLVSRDKQGKQ